jgi:hypothetical protein
MQTSHFDSIPLFTRYKGYTLSKGDLYIYQDDVEVQHHKGYGVYKDTEYLGFRFSQKQAKLLVDHHDLNTIDFN